MLPFSIFYVYLLTEDEISRKAGFSSTKAIRNAGDDAKQNDTANNEN